MSILRTLARAMALFLFLCNYADSLPREPVFLPFAACQKAAILAFDFEAIEDNSYVFLLTLQWSENDTAQREHLAKFMGDGGYDPKTNKQINTGLPIPLRLKISRLDPAGEISIYDKEIMEEELQSRGPKELEKVIDRIKLSTGNYRVHVEALTGIPELVGTPIGLGIYVHRPSVDLRPWRWQFPSQRWVFPNGWVKCTS